MSDQEAGLLLVQRLECMGQWAPWEQEKVLGLFSRSEDCVHTIIYPCNESVIRGCTWTAAV